ncbi:hypothetical protein B0H10DRAFT_1816185 [Mycena sp. CBHHK59/15]|nr:hypothetical protein B0H10DRAFT_1816185 [Mycena sp. CBHHK59/15]
MHLILTGATGTVGAPILRHCLAAPSITQLSILSRRPFALPPNAAKARVIVHADYAAYPPDVLAALHGAEACIWAQGTSQTAVSKDEYVRITYDFPLAAAKAFPALSETGKFVFVHVSANGAEPTARTLYGKTKARTEAALLALPPPLCVFNVRPGYVDPPEYHPRPGLARRAVFYGLAPVLRALAPHVVTPTAPLARVCVDLALGDGGPLPVEDDVVAEGRTLLREAVRRLGADA